MRRPSVKITITLLTFIVGVGATFMLRHSPARQRIASKLSDEQAQAAEVVTLPVKPEPVTPVAARFDFATQVGVAELESERLVCLTMRNASLNAGSKVLLVEPDSNVMHKAVVQKKLPQSCSRNPDTPEDAAFYSLKLMGNRNAPPSHAEPGAPLFGLVGIEDFERLKDGGRAKLDLDRDGRREYFRDCTSEEGVHLTIWSGKPLKGKRLWAWYYYLGYGVVPDCTERDYTEEQD